jgi:hypothetical protein
MRIFGSERLDKMLSKLGMKEGEAIVHPWVNKSLEKAQAKVEGRNFDIRKQLLKFDDVMNDQRKAIFGQRLEIMQAEDVSEIATDMRHQVIDDLVDEFMPPRTYADSWEHHGAARRAAHRLNMDAAGAGLGRRRRRGPGCPGRADHRELRQDDGRKGRSLWQGDHGVDREAASAAGDRRQVARASACGWNTCVRSSASGPMRSATR